MNILNISPPIPDVTRTCSLSVMEAIGEQTLGNRSQHTAVRRIINNFIRNNCVNNTIDLDYVYRDLATNLRMFHLISGAMRHRVFLYDIRGNLRQTLAHAKVKPDHNIHLIRQLTGGYTTNYGKYKVATDCNITETINYSQVESEDEANESNTIISSIKQNAINNKMSINSKRYDMNTLSGGEQREILRDKGEVRETALPIIKNKSPIREGVSQLSQLNCTYSPNYNNVEKYYRTYKPNAFSTNQKNMVHVKEGVHKMLNALQRPPICHGYVLNTLLGGDEKEIIQDTGEEPAAPTTYAKNIEIVREGGHGYDGGEDNLSSDSGVDCNENDTPSLANSKEATANSHVEKRRFQINTIIKPTAVNKMESVTAGMYSIINNVYRRPSANRKKYGMDSVTAGMHSIIDNVYRKASANRGKYVRIDKIIKINENIRNGVGMEDKRVEYNNNSACYVTSTTPSTHSYKRTDRGRHASGQHPTAVQTSSKKPNSAIPEASKHDARVYERKSPNHSTPRISNQRVTPQPASTTCGTSDTNGGLSAKNIKKEVVDATCAAPSQAIPAAAAKLHRIKQFSATSHRASPESVAPNTQPSSATPQGFLAQITAAMLECLRQLTIFVGQFSEYTGNMMW